MRKWWWTILLVASLCLNVGFLSSVAIHKYRRGHRHGMPELNLAPVAKEKFDANFAAFRERIRPLNSELDAERAKLMDLLAAQDPSAGSVKAQQEKVIAVNARILEAFTDHLMNQKRLLTPEEQRLFFDHIRRRSQDSGRRPNPM